MRCFRPSCGIQSMRWSQKAGSLGRQWLPSHHTIDGADLAIAATAIVKRARLLTRNIRQFPMFAELKPPY